MTDAALGGWTLLAVSIYAAGGLLFGGMFGLVTFFSAWGAAAERHGALGRRFGWAPAAVLGLGAEALFALAWPVWMIALAAKLGGVRPYRGPAVS